MAQTPQPPTITLNAQRSTTPDFRSLTLTGTVIPVPPAVDPTWRYPITLKGDAGLPSLNTSTTADANGNYSTVVAIGLTEQGNATAQTQDALGQFSNIATSYVWAGPPMITSFSSSHTGGLWNFFGQVLAAVPQGCTVHIWGMPGVDVVVQVDNQGGFSYSVPLLTNGTMNAQATDSRGQQSRVVFTYVTGN